MSIKIATGIKTEDWYAIAEYLKESNWRLTTEYNQFDKGMDFDLYEFKSANEKVLMAWDNWFEEELKSEEKTIRRFANEMNIEFDFGTPRHLTLNILEKLNSLLTSNQ